ncbi:MAG: DUF5916 domain-containing protein [Pseudomonadales bacterium]|nr:DUF5916 domain-containing protein [Pseudomonadales bacterium]MDP6827968.1 DUF5916 domain-containing protein [Pseudomonadales bacterium]
MEPTVVDLQGGEVIRLAPFSEADSAVRIDGVLDELVWRQLSAYDDFVVLDPDTLKRGAHATLIRMFHTDRGLYVGARMIQPPDTLIARLSGRDNLRLNRDSINLTIDTTGEARYGYWFGVYLGGSLSDGTVLPERLLSNEWDGPWLSASVETEDGWSAEMFIPWGTVSMPVSGVTRRMGVYFSRKVAYLDERWGWPALPRTKQRFMSALQPVEVRGVAPRQQYNIYPFTAVTSDEIDDEVSYKTGIDLFWRPSTNFQLNATLNPDFGGVESDDVVINLTATETFFPEKRLFFQEGQEIFIATARADTRSGGVGQRGDPYTMVNTRRIGGKPLTPTTSAGVSIDKRDLIRPVELEGAAKLTGQHGNLRYGVLGAFEKDAKFHGVDAAGSLTRFEEHTSDYGIARLLYQNRTGGTYRALGFLSTAVVNPKRDAYVQGIDGHYLSKEGNLAVDGQVMTSDVEDAERGYGGFIDFEYNFRQGVRQRLGIEYFDEHFDINDLGFLSRNDHLRIRSAHTRTSSNLSWARSNQFDIRGFMQRNSDHLFNGGGIIIGNRTTFDNLTEFIFRGSFFPGAYDDLNSFGNGTYRIEEKSSASLEFTSDSSKPFSYSLGAGWMNEDLGGDTFNYSASFEWRPSDRFSLAAGVTYFDREGWLLHQEGKNFTSFDAEQWMPKFSIEYFLSAKQQFRVSMQWVGIRARERNYFLVPDEPGDLVKVGKHAGPPGDFAISDMVVQVRYRWEIAPLSDLFVVYTRMSDIGTFLHGQDFVDLASDAWTDPIANTFVVKLRYRFGS